MAQIAVTPDPKYGDLTLDMAIRLAPGDDDMSVQRRLAARLSQLATEQATFREWCRVFDDLYFPTTRTEGMGFDLWPDDPSATTEGRSHISINTPSVYVDVPAALQAVEPVENMLATEDSPEARTAAQAMERIRKAWIVGDHWQLKRHKAATVKALYGRTASYVYYDRDDNHPCAEIIENPRNLWMGYKTDKYDELSWAAHVTMYDPITLVEEFSVVIDAVTDKSTGVVYPWVVGLGDQITEMPHPELTFGPARVEVWDYWFQKPGKMGKVGAETKMETWNAVVAGNCVVRLNKYDEYGGDIPFLPLFNTFIPGVPMGRSELHDMEMLIREKMARVTAGAEMIRKATAGDYWQITGPEVPARGNAGIKPKLNEVISPGPNARIEAIQPYIIQFQLEQFLGRLDREMATVSGLNDMLLGLAPAAMLNSSKAINALIANYESRISMRRLLFYTWDKATWDMVVRVWAKKDKTVRQVLAQGGGVLDIIQPSLSPRDEADTAVRAANLVAAKLWSQARGMDAVGVDDPEQEQNIMRAERTDATLFPADVQTMAQLMGLLQQLGLNQPQGAQSMLAGQEASGTEALRQALGGATPQGNESMQGPEQQGMTPPIEGAGPNAGGAPAPFAQAQVPTGATTQLQTMLQNGQPRNRIMSTQQVGGPVGRR